jgi:hypothetical protein
MTLGLNGRTGLVEKCFLKREETGITQDILNLPNHHIQEGTFGINKRWVIS